MVEGSRMDSEPANREKKANGEAGGAALLRRPEEQPAEIAVDGKLPIERIAGLPVQLDVRIPVPDFRISDLLGLTPGQVVSSEWPSSDDVPLTSGDVQLVWTEFEVVDQTLAVRVTRLV